MDGRPTWTDCDEAGDYVVPNVLSPRDLVFRPDNMDKTVQHTHKDTKRNVQKRIHYCHQQPGENINYVFGFHRQY